MKIIDISPEISQEIAVWPGDTPYQREVLMDTDHGDHLGLSKIVSTLHLGAHADAPNHYAPQSQGISERSLNYYYGSCQVINCRTAKGESIQVEDLATQEIFSPRVLLKTGSFPNSNQWDENFCSLSVGLVEFLADKNVLLVGIDTPSVDPFSSKTLEAHKKIHSFNMAILEGLDLAQVEEGKYVLCALPLKLKGADASPVRAVLIEEGTQMKSFF